MERIELYTVIHLLSFFILLPLSIYCQSGIIIDIPEHDTLILKGNVKVIHCPSHYYKDTTEVMYDHYIMIYRQDTLVKYHEIFDSDFRDSLLSDSYKFKLENDTMYFYSEDEFLNFTGFAKTLFTSYPDYNSNSIKATPRILKSDTISKLGIDTSCYYFFEFNSEGIVERRRNISIVKSGKINKIEIEMFELSDVYGDIKTFGKYKKPYQSINHKTMGGEIDSTGFYSNFNFNEIRENSIGENQRKSSIRNLTCTYITSFYERLEKVPDEILKYLKQLNYEE